MAVMRTHRRSPSGEPVIGRVPRRRGPVIAGMVALTVEAPTAMMSLEAVTSGDVSLTYVEEVLGPELQPRDFVVLPDLGAHEDRRVRAAVEARGPKLLCQLRTRPATTRSSSPGLGDVVAARGGRAAARLHAADVAGVYHGGWTLGGFEIWTHEGRPRGCFTATGAPIDVTVDGAVTGLRWADGEQRYSALYGPISADRALGTAQSFDAAGAPSDVGLVQVERMVDAERQCAPAPGGTSSQLDGLADKLEKDGRAAVYNLLFDFGSDGLRPEAGAVLDKIARILTDHADWKLVVEGHTDDVGSDADNLDLSERRAAAAVRGLVERGIAADRLRSAGFGEGRPVATNATPNGRAENRRVELVRE